MSETDVNQPDAKLQELTGLLEEVRARVGVRYPEGTAGSEVPEGRVMVPLADLMPLVHARDAAQAKMAAIGSVNPRRGGVVNGLIQSLKQLTARSLNWFVRDQVTFNRGMVACVEASLQAMNEMNHAMASLCAQLDSGGYLEDIRAHWSQWRGAWEHKLAATETHLLRTVAELQRAQLQRAGELDQSFRELVQRQHAEYRASLETAMNEVQQKLWSDLDRIKNDYERLIHTELRMVRQKTAGGVTVAASTPMAASIAEAAAEAAEFDYQKFADKFRGPEEYVRRNHQMYLGHFAGCGKVLDIGCGRGEMLRDLGANGIAARGIDLSAESVAYCRSQGMDAVQADLYQYLPQLADGELDGIYCSQVVEHLPPLRLAEMIRLCGAKLRRDGVIAIETPNPECLAIFATHFYLDPTHSKPVPPSLLAFYLEEAGFGRIAIEPLSPAAESIPELRELPEAVVRRLFGGMDYAIFARKL